MYHLFRIIILSLLQKVNDIKKIKLGPLPQILIAIALGIAAGTVSPELPVRVFVTFNALFSQFLNFIIPLIIVGLVTPAIADIGKGAGKMLVATVLLAYGATLFSGFLSFGVGETFFPDLITRNIPLSEISEANFSDHGANRLGASALMQGLADGYFVLPYTIQNYLADQYIRSICARVFKSKSARPQVLTLSLR